jgi:hypothetical protein
MGTGGVRKLSSPPVDLELTPEQPPAVAEAVAAVLAAAAWPPDPWWQAGIDEILKER